MRCCANCVWSISPDLEEDIMKEQGYSYDNPNRPKAGDCVIGMNHNKNYYCKAHDYIDGMEENEQNSKNITINKHYLGIEDLVFNGFIELSKVANIREIPLIVLEQYGEEVIKHLNKDYNERRAFLILSRNHTTHFENNYSNLIEIKDNIVILKDNIEITKLIDKSRMYMNFEILKAFMNEEVVINGLYINYLKYLQTTNEKENISLIEKLNNSISSKNKTKKGQLLRKTTKKSFK